MVELTDREKIIIQSMTYLLHNAIKNFPTEQKINFAKIALNARDIEISTEELRDLIFAVEQEQKDAIQNLMKKLGGS